MGLLVVFSPIGEVALLFPDIDEARPALKNSKGVAQVIFLNVTAATEEPCLTLPLNFASPDAPLNRSKVRGT